MFRFAYPEYLHLLYLLPVLAVFYFFYLKKKKSLLKKFADERIHDVLFGIKSFYMESIRFGFVVIGIALLILALARPQIGNRVEEVKQIGIDVYILLDVSASMQAEDIKPSRLEKAKNEIAMLIKKLQGDRIGLIIFAGDAYVQFPLTTDYSAANLFLSTVDVNSIPQQGTAIASAISLASKSFDAKSATKKVMVIITDGEDHEGDIDSAVKDATDKDIMIYTIGMGSPSGAPIPVFDGNNNQVGFKQDENGNTVLTKLDETTLQQIASKGGGKYYLSSSYQNELDMIYKDLSSLEKTEYGSKRITDYDDKYFYFLIPALLFLVIELFLTDRKSKFLMQILKRNV
ncbi:MAG: VWA domain-containing protein [Ignavibacteriaceae bacterium]|jgi:Ca-activated chloride channel family protein